MCVSCGQTNVKEGIKCTVRIGFDPQDIALFSSSQHHKALHPKLPNSQIMDSFITISTPFTTSVSEETSTQVEFENGGGGGRSYCVIAWRARPFVCIFPLMSMRHLLTVLLEIGSWQFSHCTSFASFVVVDICIITITHIRLRSTTSSSIRLIYSSSVCAFSALFGSFGENLFVIIMSFEQCDSFVSWILTVVLQHPAYFSRWEERIKEQTTEPGATKNLKMMCHQLIVTSQK